VDDDLVSDHPIDSLTDSELAVARLLAQGMTHKEAARHLARSPDTVRGHVKAIFTKLAINNAVLLNPLVSLRD
jgi:DNA-binding NarL/FixJ family response regulator